MGCQFIAPHKVERHTEKEKQTHKLIRRNASSKRRMLFDGSKFAEHAQLPINLLLIASGITLPN